MMRFAHRLAVLLLAASVLGIGSALYMSGTSRMSANGPWRILPSGVMPDQSPYALSHFAFRGMLSPDTSQMAVFTAATDSDGAGLDADCTYAVSGNLPPSRWWSLAVADDPAAVLSSGHVITGADGSFAARVSASAGPGNWLALSQSGGFELVLRFHGPAGALKDAPLRAALPAIRKGECT